MPDMTVDLSGPSATIEAGKTGGSDAWSFRFMIRDGNGNWYIADNDMTGSNTTLILNLPTTPRIHVPARTNPSQ